MTITTVAVPVSTLLDDEPSAPDDDDNGGQTKPLCMYRPHSAMMSKTGAGGKSCTYMMLCSYPLRCRGQCYKYQHSMLFYICVPQGTSKVSANAVGTSPSPLHVQNRGNS